MSFLIHKQVILITGIYNLSYGNCTFKSSTRTSWLYVKENNLFYMRLWASRKVMPRIHSFINLNMRGRGWVKERRIKNKAATSRKLSGKSVKSLVVGGLLRAPRNREKEKEAEMCQVLLVGKGQTSKWKEFCWWFNQFPSWLFFNKRPPFLISR